MPSTQAIDISDQYPRVGRLNVSDKTSLFAHSRTTSAVISYPYRGFWDQGCGAGSLLRGSEVWAVALWVICPRAARAQVPCRLERPSSPYSLTSDIIEWRLTIGAGQSCVRGLRYAAVTIDDIQLVTAPQSGQVTFEGTAFLYQAAPDFWGWMLLGLLYRENGILNGIL